MRVLVTGGRDFTDREMVFEALDFAGNIDLLIHGGQTGADDLADDWARSRGVFVAAFPVFPETWRRVGRSAGPMRNRMMFNLAPDTVIAFPGGDGTASTIQIAKSLKIPVVTYPK